MVTLFCPIEQLKNLATSAIIPYSDANILAELTKIERLNVGLAFTPASPRQVEIMRKKITEIFSKHGLSITSEANLKTVDFLDVVFDLETETYRPFIKPNTIPL